MDPTAYYVDIFTFVYVDDVHTSQEIHLRPPQPVTGIALPSRTQYPCLYFLS
jgi:hypothetical protein